MADITTIETDKLLKDFWDSKNDIMVCELALQIGAVAPEHTYTAEELMERIEGNNMCIEVIKKELERRGCADNIDTQQAISAP